jgi:fructose-bisphosphate aldolase class I
MPSDDLRLTAQQMVAPGKGILAADESTGTMNKRLTAENLDTTEEVRRQYRQLITSTPNLGTWISCVILYDETVRQVSDDGTPLRQLAVDNGVMPGIKVDKGAKPLAGSDDEKITEGLDGLRERLDEYRELGMKFTKWRAVLDIGGGHPSFQAIRANAQALARYAALSQEAGLVPMVEPEVLMDGDHTLEQAEDATTRALREVFSELAIQNVRFEEMVLKPNMVVAGKENPNQPSTEEVADATVRALSRTVPPAVPGIAFLSGGQSDETATVNLNAINQRGTMPWQLTFSYGRGLLAPTLHDWAGKPENVQKAQETLIHRSKLNAAARDGKYDPSLEQR